MIDQARDDSVEGGYKQKYEDLQSKHTEVLRVIHEKETWWAGQYKLLEERTQLASKEKDFRVKAA